MSLQLTTAAGALLGTAIGASLGQMYLNESLAFTSGGFLYFAINGLLSEIKKVDDMSSMMNCLIAMTLGLYFMYVFALLE